MKIVGVHIGGLSQNVKRFYDEGKYTFPTIMSFSADIQFEIAYGVRTFATVFIIDSNGKIADRFITTNIETIKTALKKLGIE